MDERVLICPQCGEELSGDMKVYLDEFGNIVGCEKCMSVKEAYDIILAMEEADERRFADYDII